MEPQRRDLAYNAYLKEHPGGNFTRFSQLSQAGKRSYGDPTAHPWPVSGKIVAPAVPSVVEPVARVGQGPSPTVHRSRVPAADDSKELRRKLAWAVGSTWGLKANEYSRSDHWIFNYARRAAERLIEMHGEP